MTNRTAAAPRQEEKKDHVLKNVSEATAPTTHNPHATHRANVSGPWTERREELPQWTAEWAEGGLEWAGSLMVQVIVGRGQFVSVTATALANGWRAPLAPGGGRRVVRAESTDVGDGC